MIAPARASAFEVLRAVNTRRADLPGALVHSRSGLSDERDRALAGEIATGTLRWQGAFDHIIAAFARRPIARLDPEVLDILRMTAFQILHLDRVPVSAAVNDAVNLTRAIGKTSAAGLVNAVLRRISREQARLPLPPRPDSQDTAAALAYLATTLSHPEWLVARWLNRYGFEATEAWARFDNEPAPMTLRANTLKGSRDAVAAALEAHGVRTEPTRFAPEGLVVSSGNPLRTPAAAEGVFVVQDESSQLVALLAAARPGELVLDACASPGGKTTAMAGEMWTGTSAGLRAGGFIVASDVRGRRVDLLAAAVRAASASRVALVQADAAAALPFGQVFDCVLLDAPCSGLGTLRRDPDIRWRRTAEDLRSLAATQFDMLEQAARVLKPEGRLVYSTCSSEPEENEQVVTRFLERRTDMRLASTNSLPSGVRQFADDGGYFRTLPFRDELEGFFAAMLVKTKDLR